VLSIPGGAFLALFITHTALSMPSMIGLIMLMGIATKNSILLVEYAIVARRDHGLNRWDALLDACHKRARPIVMTTIAMGAGMLPIALGFGTDPSFRAPMAIVVIGGLITSTFLSLLVIPVGVHLRRRLCLMRICSLCSAWACNAARQLGPASFASIQSRNARVRAGISRRPGNTAQACTLGKDQSTSTGISSPLWT
jgi:hypothetical protein